MDVQQGNTTSPTTTATTSTVGRPCAQCQSRHLSCDRQRPCRRCVEAGPGLAMNCCDPTDAPRKRGRPPGACRKRRSATAPTALATPTPPTVLYPAPKRARAEPGSLLVPPPVPFAGPQPAAASPPLPQQAWASPADDPTSAPGSPLLYIWLCSDTRRTHTHDRTRTRVARGQGCGVERRRGLASSRRHRRRRRCRRARSRLRPRRPAVVEGSRPNRT
jgi:hypothetical protein